MKQMHLVLIIIVALASAYAEEGMYPISEIQNLDLESKGLEISVDEIYNPGGISILDGICNIGGCSAALISPEGLILTNHHCAYRVIQSISTPEQDYLQDGFLARTRSEEKRALGRTVRINVSYEDVSEEMLSVLTEDMGLAERTRALEKRKKEIITRIEEANPGMRADVSEMFAGRTYVLFVYTYLKDVRLVYAPPRSIGNFGGEVDNWMWPRHTGDFTFLRAYTGPDGEPADYSPDNVPYKPKRYLRVAPDGVEEEDFVFILGYPGKTYRHRTSYYLSYEEEIRMPYIVELYGWQMDLMEKMGEGNRAIALKLAPTIKSLANRYKNYGGKLQGLYRIGLVEKKRREEEKLQRFIESDPDRKAEYGDIIDGLRSIYAGIREHSDRELFLDNFLSRSVLMDAAYKLYKASIERHKPDLDRDLSYMDRSFHRTKQRVFMSIRNFHEPTDRIILKEMLLRGSRLSEGSIPALDDISKNGDKEAAIDAFIDELYTNTQLDDVEFVTQAFTKTQQEIEAMDDAFIRFAIALYPTYQEHEEALYTRKGAYDKLNARLVDVKEDWLGTRFIPDANGTLRLTYGNIRRYSPRDAVVSFPITSTQGVLEKTTGEEPFDTPQALLDLIKTGDFGRFGKSELDGVPVAILYDMDTTGGNSGSAVLNARGELVGVNFDRAFEATINDYAWNQDYSRSIAVDIRYVLWVTQKFGKAQFLLDEMGVD